MLDDCLGATHQHDTEIVGNLQLCSTPCHAIDAVHTYHCMPIVVVVRCCLHPCIVIFSCFTVTGVSMLILIMINCVYVYIGAGKRNQNAEHGSDGE